MSRIPQYFQNVLSSGEESDFSIFVFDEEGNKIEKKVHRVVIRQCPYFGAMLDLKGKEVRKGSVTIDNITSEVFDYVLRFIYTDHPGDMTMKQAIQVTKAADYLQLEDLRTAALDSWKKSVTNLKEKKDVIKATQVLIYSSLNIELNKSWREALEAILVAIAVPPTDFDIATESSTFIEVVIRFFEKTHPNFAVHTLAKWVSASDIKLTNKKRIARKKIAAELIKGIKMIDLSLQGLAIISKAEAFPVSYIMKKMQETVDMRDIPTHDIVEYTVKTKTSRVLELEFEGSYILFRFMGVKDGADENTVVWELMNVPNNCKTTVTLTHPDEKDIDWPVNNTQGIVLPNMKTYLLDSGEFNFVITLMQEGAENTVKFSYDVVYDE